MTAENEKRTAVFDWEKGDFMVDPQGRVVVATEADAVAQIVIKAQQTARRLYLIYGDFNKERDHKYGTDVAAILTRGGLSEEARTSELKRAIKEALVYDPWVTDVTDINIYRETTKLDTGEEKALDYASFNVKHIFGQDAVEGVSLNG